MFKSALILNVFLPLLAFARITVDINSGDPASPFPRFRPYANSTETLYNLSTRTPVGVSHAEMEKSIREAYRIMMNRAEKKGGSLGGVDYIHFRSSPECSEGDGYAMLAAAAMADKTTFDGLWLRVHDYAMNKVKRYNDCEQNSPDYRYSELPGWTNKAGDNSAADGDFDIALALLTACRQWGEFMGIDDGCGNPISYKQAAIDFITALTDTFTYTFGLYSGDIGLDGYFKGGDTWQELTAWATDTVTSGLPKPPQNQGPTKQHADYMAPAYFNQFAEFLAGIDSATYAWNIRQFRRAAAASDWLMGKLLDNPADVPFAGDVELSAENRPTFTAFSDAEDFRLAWRTILNYLWHGNPASTWNPVTHQAVAGSQNSFERDIGIRYANFLWDTRQNPWNNSCETVSNSTSSYWGPSVLKYRYSLTGEPTATFMMNWVPGTGSPSAVASQNFDLMAELYRQCEIEYDVETADTGYLTATPQYFHGWFRLLGMLVLSGNYTAPLQIRPEADMKVYCDVDKTFAHPGDEITYTLTYRNFGSVDADGVALTDTVPVGLSYSSCSGNGTFDQPSRTVTWDIGTVPGFKTATGISPTTGSVTLKVVAGNAAPLQCRNRAVVSCSNGPGWTSDEYPNTVSPTMKRNLVDVINKVSDAPTEGNRILPLYGGREGIHFSFSAGSEGAASAMLTLRVRLFNDAQESYINYGNYRFSYFLYDTVNTCLSGDSGCTAGWSMSPMIAEGVSKDQIHVLHEMLVPGQTERGKWNQRIIIQFSDPGNPGVPENLATINRMLESYFGIGSRIHRGVLQTLRIEMRLNTSAFEPVDWGDDWSYTADRNSDEAGYYFPITPDFTGPAPGNPGIPVDRCNPKHCETVDSTVDNILVEEWDGCTWRKVFGNAPQAAVAAANKPAVLRPAEPKLWAAASAIRFSLPAAGAVRLQLFDMKGRVAATLADGFHEAGVHKVSMAVNRTGSEVCLLRLVTDSGTLTRKVVQLR